MAGEQEVWGHQDTIGTPSEREQGEAVWQLIRAEEAPTLQGRSSRQHLSPSLPVAAAHPCPGAGTEDVRRGAASR